MKNLLLGVLTLLCITLGNITANAAEPDEGASDLKYIIKNDSVYYESSFGFGSGRSGKVNKSNIYTEIPCLAGINGYAFLNEQGEILLSDYIESENDIIIPSEPEGTVKVFIHFKTKHYRNGWTNFENVIETPSDNFNEEEQVPEEQEPEEVIEDIKESIQKNRRTAVIVDFSGSMSDNQLEVIKLLNTLEFNENTFIIVFAEYFEIVSHEQLITGDFYVGSDTHMVAALNKATSLDIENMIIISDLNTYNDVVLEKNENLKTVTIYDPDDGIEDQIVDKVLRDVWNNTKISRIKIK